MCVELLTPNVSVLLFWSIGNTYLWPHSMQNEKIQTWNSSKNLEYILEYIS